jgi:hypothetical protein
VKSSVSLRYLLCSAVLYGSENFDVAMLVLSALEGASLIAWTLNDTSFFKPTIKQVVASLQP